MATDPSTPPPAAPGPEPDGYRARIRALVDAAPPLSPRQRERLRLILGGVLGRRADEPPAPRRTPHKRSPVHPDPPVGGDAA
ncbi:hypothetical protein [Streptomyces sp. CC228A]|uniref:hypothetical protein n=1 Tax=Streptomyces sp. CC228A TaxID=2898186 RepID=UPI001F296EF5|nr:hypothetical protein [Streptomyces sp. CC228A]